MGRRGGPGKKLPALSIALVDDQRIVWARGFGFADAAGTVPASADTVYRVGSVSKLFTDLAVMQLVEQGRLDLDAPVSRLLPEFTPVNPFKVPITLRHLMSHRAGSGARAVGWPLFRPESATAHRAWSRAWRAQHYSLNRARAPSIRTRASPWWVPSSNVWRESHFPRRSTESLLKPLGMTRSSFEPGAELVRQDGSWRDVDLRRTDDRDAHVSARHGARGQSGFVGERPGSISSASCLRRGVGPPERLSSRRPCDR